MVAARRAPAGFAWLVVERRAHFSLFRLGGNADGQQRSNESYAPAAGAGGVERTRACVKRCAAMPRS